MKNKLTTYVSWESGFEHMKAVFCTKYGGPEVLQFKEVEIPKPKDNEILLRVIGATLTAGDCEIRRFEIHPLFWLYLRINLGLFRPKNLILGLELSGEVVELGKKVKTFQKSQLVFASTQIKLGAHAEYVCLPSSYPIYPVPTNMDPVLAGTLITGGLNGLHFVKKAKLKPGEKLLIYGAGGAIGTFAIQVAKEKAVEITVVDKGSKLEKLKSIGADYAIDFQKENITQSKLKFDAIIDVVGKIPYGIALNLLNPNGRLVLANPSTLDLIRSINPKKKGGKQLITRFAPYSKSDLKELCELVENGKVKPLIDRRISFSEIIEAHKYVDTGDKTGNLIVEIGKTA